MLKPNRANVSSLLLLCLLSLWVVLRTFRMPQPDNTMFIRTAPPGGFALSGGVPPAAAGPAPGLTAAALPSLVTVAPANCTEEVNAAVQRAKATWAASLPVAPAPAPDCPPPPAPVKCPVAAPCPACATGTTASGTPLVCPQVSCVDQVPRLVPAMPGLPAYNPRDLPTCVNAPAMMLRTPPPVPAEGVSDATATERVVLSSLPKRKLLPPTHAKTEYQCYQSADWAEMCQYNLLCTDGDRAVFIDDTQPEGTPVKFHFGMGDDPVGSHTFDVSPRPPPPTQGLPTNTRMEAYYMSSKALQNAEWTDKAMWLIQPEYRTWEVQHIFFFAHSVFPLWEARESNATWGNVLPPIEEVFYMVQRKFKFNNWNNDIMNYIMPPTATLGFLDDLTPYGPRKLRCSTRGVITGMKPNLFSGMKPAVNFRNMVYSSFGIENLKHPAKKLLIYNRANAGRRFENIEEIEALLKRYEIPYEIRAKAGSFEDQVRAMAESGVVLLAHGAAATNTMFQQHRSVLIEVFPYLRKRFGFMSVAQVIGNFYMPIYTWKKSVTGKSVMNETEFLTACEDLSSIYTNRVGVCDAAQKVVTIHVDIPTLERTLIDAFDIIGHRIYDKNLKPGAGFND